MALALPLLEVSLSVVRRFLSNEPIFNGDRGHIHHRLLDLGLTPRGVALWLYGVCGVGATLSLLQSSVHTRWHGLVVVLFGAGICVGVHRLRYVEFEVTGRFLRNTLRPMLGGHVRLQRLEEALQSAASVEECWRAVERAGNLLGYSQINARLSGAKFQTTMQTSRNDTFWQMRLNLPGSDYVNITQRERGSEHPMLVIPFVEILGRSPAREAGDNPVYSPTRFQKSPVRPR